MADNGFFRPTDQRLSEVAGFRLPEGWWSRPWEYAWTLEYAQAGHIAADMGCGYTYRPFKDALADVCEHVYAVDANPKVADLEPHPGLEYVAADISAPILAIPAGSLDRVYCISVLEDTQAKLPQILCEFARCLRDDGLILLTFDTPYQVGKPCPVWPGLGMGKFMEAMEAADLEFIGSEDWGRDEIIYHEEWNLTVCHAALRKAV